MDPTAVPGTPPRSGGRTSASCATFPPASAAAIAQAAAFGKTMGQLQGASAVSAELRFSGSEMRRLSGAFPELAELQGGAKEAQSLPAYPWQGLVKPPCISAFPEMSVHTTSRVKADRHTSEQEQRSAPGAYGGRNAGSFRCRASSGRASLPHELPSSWSKQDHSGGATARAGSVCSNGASPERSRSESLHGSRTSVTPAWSGPKLEREGAARPTSARGSPQRKPFSMPKGGAGSASSAGARSHDGSERSRSVGASGSADSSLRQAALRATRTAAAMHDKGASGARRSPEDRVQAAPFAARHLSGTVERSPTATPATTREGGGHSRGDLGTIREPAAGSRDPLIAGGSVFSRLARTPTMATIARTEGQSEFLGEPVAVRPLADVSRRWRS